MPSLTSRGDTSPSCSSSRTPSPISWSSGMDQRSFPSQTKYSNPSPLLLDPRHLMAHQHPMPPLLHDLPAPLPHLPRPQPRILELIDQRLDRGGVRARKEGAPDGYAQRQALDPLRRPFGTDLGAWNS